MRFFWVALGSAVGGVARYAVTLLTISLSQRLPWGTILINIVGSFVIGFFGTLTLHGSRFAVSDNARLFVMVGICGGFTTFSSFSLQTLDLLRVGAYGRVAANIVLSVVLCVLAVGCGHLLAERFVPGVQIAQTRTEELAG